MIALPDTMAGHWDTAEGRDIAVDYLTKPREWLGKSELSDFALANAQYLEDISVGTVTFQSAIAMQTAAKERIRWLSAHLANTLAALEAFIAEADAGHVTVKTDRDARAAIAKARGEVA